jgi:glycosyltransferase involved in cell wall biosynthesis
VRILVATDQWSPDVVSGAARVAAATGQLLAERGHEVTVISPRVTELPLVERNGTLELHRSLRRAPLPQTYADPVDTWRWARHRRDWPDVVLAHQATVAAGMLAARVRAPLAYVYHASAPLEQRFRRRYLSPLRRTANLALHPSFVLLEHVAVGRAARILVLSDFSRGLVSEAHPEVGRRVVHVRGGVDTSVFAPDPKSAASTRSRLGIPLDRPFLLTVRRLEPRMGIEELLRACRQLVGDGLDFTLGVAGSGMLAARLRVLSENLGLEDRVRFLGRVAESSLPGLYAAADLFVLPTIAYEGFGMSTLEALAAGTPVVGTPVGATPELLRPLDPMLVAPGMHSREIADTLARVLGSLDLRFRARCAEYARRRFDWREAIHDWEEALEETTRQRGAARPVVPRRI